MLLLCVFFFFNDTATTEIYTLSLHDALPIYPVPGSVHIRPLPGGSARVGFSRDAAELVLPTGHLPWGVAVRHGESRRRSEEHTSELQSRQYLVCRLLLEKKKIQLIRLTHASP